MTIEPVRVPAGFWDLEDVAASLSSRDLATLFYLLCQRAGARKASIAVSTGLTPAHVGRIMKRQAAADYRTTYQVATALDMPDRARRSLGLAAATAQPAGDPDAAPRAHSGEALRVARESRGVALPTLARDIGRDKGHLSRVERGQRVPTPALVREYERALGVSIEAPASTARPAVDSVCPERAFFGSGPITVAVPLRTMPGRARPVISSEDAQAAEDVTRLLVDLGLNVESFRIPTHGLWQPSVNTVAICGPKSSAITSSSIEADPYLAFDADQDGVWRIRERDGKGTYLSLLDATTPEPVDVAYVARLPLYRGTFLVVAGVHALGSVGAVHYLSRHLPDLHATVGDRCFSMVVRSAHDGDRVTHSELIAPVRVHQ